MPTPDYDYKKTLWKAAKTGLVAAAAFAIADPGLAPALLAVVPAEYRMIATIALPALISAIRNWIKRAPTGF